MHVFNKTFRRLFGRSGLSVYRCAQVADMDEKYVRNLLNGKKHNPSLRTVIKLARALGSDPKQVKLYPELAEAKERLIDALLEDAADDCESDT